MSAAATKPKDSADRRRAALDASQARARTKPRLQALEPVAPLTDSNMRKLKDADRERHAAAVDEDIAQRLSDQGDKVGAKRRRGEAKRHLTKARELTDAVAGDRAERTDQRWISAALDETAALEIARGEDVERPKGGGLRVKSRDGLQAMFAAEAIDARQLKAGALFGDTYGRCRSGLGSQLGAMQPSSGGSTNSVAEAVANRMKAIATMGELRSAIHGAFLRQGHRSKEGENAIVLVEQVAGEGSPIRRLASGGAKRQAMGDALRRALNALADHYKLPHL